MIIEEFFKYRDNLLEKSSDEKGLFQEALLLENVLPSMLDAKLIDSEDSNPSYYINKKDKIKVNSYCVNESGERLQLFVIDEKSADLSVSTEDLEISVKSKYDTLFKRTVNFVNKAMKRHLNDVVKDTSPVKPLLSQMSSIEGADQFDVVEIFLISLSATVSSQGDTPQPKRFEFDKEEITINVSKEKERFQKKVLIQKRLIDLNFLYNIEISQGNREALKIDFAKMHGAEIPTIKAAEEKNFESYLCVLPAPLIADLYKEYSTRLLEKNVRSFLQFKGVNKGIKDTIKNEPEKFVAYNNGLTITATSAEISAKKDSLSIRSLTDFQIVNGGQTTATIYFSQKEGLDVSRVKVMAKINVAKETSEEELDELISNISTYSNTQSKVSRVDLRSRSPQLIKIKSLTESVLTPSGLKWFFERAKGEYNTLLRIAGTNRNRIKKEYPSERKFSKEQLARYYCAWGEQPYLIKKGGEKVFRFFIEALTGEGTSKKPLEINRNFYEDLIPKMVIYRKLEDIYGQGPKSMGQLRSAVVPYSISLLYKFTSGNRKADSFDLSKIWKEESLGKDLEVFLKKLLLLVNELVKKYSKSDDIGEYSKKPELWDAISKSTEVNTFMASASVLSLLKKYAISKEEEKKRSAKVRGKKKEIDFSNLNRVVEMYDRGEGFYTYISQQLADKITDDQRNKLFKIRTLVKNFREIDNYLLNFEINFMKEVRAKYPEVLDTVKVSTRTNLRSTFEFIREEYNKALDQKLNIRSEFSKFSEICRVKNIKYGSVFDQIGEILEEGEPITLTHLRQASYFAGNKMSKD